MLAKAIPKDARKIAELFFGNGKVPKGAEGVRKWIVAHNIDRSDKSHTGTELNSWHLTEWDRSYYLIYISDDDGLFAINLPLLTIFAFNKPASDFNNGQGWFCNFYYDIDDLIKPFGFINWMEVDPFGGSK